MTLRNKESGHPDFPLDGANEPSDYEQLLQGEFRALLDVVPALVWLTHDTDARLMQGNRQANDFLGLPATANPSKSGSSPPRHFEVWRDGKPVGADDLPLQRSARGEVIRDYQEEIVFDDGRRHTIYGNAAPLYDLNGNPRGSIGAFIDITSLADRLAAQQRSEERALHLAASRMDVLREVAHDMRQPLTAITGAIERFERVASERDRRHVTRAKKSLARLDEAMGILQQMASMDFVESAQLSPVSLQSLLDELAEHFAPIAEDKGLHFRVMPCSLTALSDARLLKTILFNLIGNAIKYTKKGRVLVGCRRRDETVTISVRDTGVGMPESKLSEIFTAFTRLSPQQADGMGLGLSIVDHCAKLLGQRVSVVSKEGRGSSFSITIPLTS